MNIKDFYGKAVKAGNALNRKKLCKWKIRIGWKERREPRL